MSWRIVGATEGRKVWEFDNPTRIERLADDTMVAHHADGTTELVESVTEIAIELDPPGGEVGPGVIYSGGPV